MPRGTMTCVIDQQRGSKERRRCYFCGDIGPMSKEHAWPQWLGVGAVVEPTRTNTVVGFHQTSADTFTELPNLRTIKQGSVLTTKTREVCRRCNNQWMSTLESAARPILERLWSQSWREHTRSLAESDLSRDTGVSDLLGATGRRSRGRLG